MVAVRSLPSCSVRHPSSIKTRSFHSLERPYGQTERRILTAALARVPEYGFTDRTLTRGAQDVECPEASINLFPRRAFDLVNFHLISQREALQNNVDFEADEPIAARIRKLLWKRLMANTSVISHWQDALAVMAQPSNASTSIAELARLADEVCFLAGDASVDFSWYTKRGSLSTVYSTTELYMTQDKSPGFNATSEFLDKRLTDAQAVGQGLSQLTEWLSFTGSSIVNVARSKGVGI